MGDFDEHENKTKTTTRSRTLRLSYLLDKMDTTPDLRAVLQIPVFRAFSLALFLLCLSLRELHFLFEFAHRVIQHETFMFIRFFLAKREML